MRSITKPWITFFTYPATWLAAGLILALHIAFTLALQPTLAWSLFALGLDLAGAAGWFAAAFKSKSFRERLNRMPYEGREKETAALIRSAPDQFKTPALACLGLIQKINAEFPDKAYSYELELLLLNLHELAKNHHTLWSRYQSFGDAAQKKRMEAMLEGQRGAVRHALAVLKTFSGNLTLLEAKEDQSRAAADALKDINEGLKEVIAEEA